MQCRLTDAELMDKSDRELFCKLCAPMHDLNHLLPPSRNNICLRAQGHSYELPEYSTSLYRESKKGAILTMAITLSILGGFAKFFHCCQEQ